MMNLGNLSRQDLLERARAKRRLLLREESDALSADLGAFTRGAWSQIERKKYLHNWHIDAIADHLTAVTNKQIKRLIINVPFRTMKSTLVSVIWPAWTWTFDPSHQFLTGSHAEKLAIRDNVKHRRLTRSNWYQDRWGHKFGFTDDQNQKIRFENDQSGYRIAFGMTSGVTGDGGDTILIDDPLDRLQSTSVVEREKVNEIFDETLVSRLNEPEHSAIVIIMQRLHEDDLSGHLLAKEAGDWDHLMLPMEFDSKRKCYTSIGFEDPREGEGELLWEERFPPKVVTSLKKTLGPYGTAGQLQQSPEVKGGGIIKREWWQLWESPDGKFPRLDYILASADTAYTEKEENDPTGFVILGLFKHSDGFPKVVLLTAWRKRLEIHGRNTERQSGETEAQWIKRTQKDWGLCEWLAYSCRRFKVDRLIIEGKASGLSVAQEMRRLHSQEGWGIMTVTPDGDKVARAYAVQSLFSDGLIYAPDREWAQMVIDEMAVFPKGSYKDLTDAMTQGLKHLREVGLAVRREERVFEEEDRRKHKAQLQPLYDV